MKFQFPPNFFPNRPPTACTGASDCGETEFGEDEGEIEGEGGEQRGERRRGDPLVEHSCAVVRCTNAFFLHSCVVGKFHSCIIVCCTLTQLCVAQYLLLSCLLHSDLLAHN